jgi:hypothetical protein
LAREGEGRLDSHDLDLDFSHLDLDLLLMEKEESGFQSGSRGETQGGAAKRLCQDFFLLSGAQVCWCAGLLLFSLLGVCRHGASFQERRNISYCPGMLCRGQRNAEILLNFIILAKTSGWQLCVVSSWTAPNHSRLSVEQ